MSPRPVIIILARSSLPLLTYSHPPTSLANVRPLLHLPSETLIHLTSFLPPSSLITLLLVCKHLHSAVSDEVAWRSSYEFNFLSGDSQAGGLMRSCLTGGGAAKGWKKEAVGREKFL